MLSGSLWGRPRWIWVIDVVVVLGLGTAAVLSDVPAIRLFLVAVIVLRVALATAVSLLWRSRRRAQGPAA